MSGCLNAETAAASAGTSRVPEPLGKGISCRCCFSARCVVVIAALDISGASSSWCRSADDLILSARMREARPSRKARALCAHTHTTPSGSWVNLEVHGFPEGIGQSVSRGPGFHPWLLYRTGDRRKRVVSVGTNQANRANYNHENNSQHYGIFRNVLAVLIVPERTNEVFHGEGSLEASLLRDPSSLAKSTLQKVTLVTESRKASEG